MAPPTSGMRQTPLDPRRAQLRFSGSCRRLGQALALGCCTGAFVAGSAFARQTAPGPRRRSPAPAYVLQIDSARTDVLAVAIRFRAMPATFFVAMKVHPEYNAGYWRDVEGMRVVGSADDAAAGVVRLDTTLWRVTLPGGSGELQYRLRVQAPDQPGRAWQTRVRADGALINPPDVFLYAPAFAHSPVSVDLRFPRSWSVATALPAGAARDRRTARDAATLLDSPILLGRLRHWTFSGGGARFHVAYWPLPDATPFDTVAFVDGLRRLALAAIGVFGRTPSPEYDFLLLDGAGDALEHGRSVTIGIRSAALARDPHAQMAEIAHEFFHTWNLVAIRPAGFNDLSYGTPARTSGLWLGEGVTLHYAQILPRRAALVPARPSRLDHLAELLEAYYGSPAVLRVPPERASLAFGDSPVTDPDATGGYYLQGELLGEVLDARVRQATGERRGLDDVMRALFLGSRGPSYRGFTSHDLVTASDSVCGCQLDAFFASSVRGAGPIDAGPVLGRIGLRLVLYSVPAADSAGQALPDRRLGLDYSAPPGLLRLVVTTRTTPWAQAGVRTGDQLLAMDGTAMRSNSEVRAALARLHVRDRVLLRLRRAGEELELSVTVSGYLRPRVRFVDAPDVTPAQRARRLAWLAGE